MLFSYQNISKVFVLEAVLSMVYTIASINWQTNYSDNHFYLQGESSPGSYLYFERFLVFVVAYSQLIPISLYVALEVLKLIQAYLIAFDQDLYYKEINKRANVRTSDLIEELGQIEFIFSDKTGTLTCNIMDFKKCSINGVIFGESNYTKVQKLLNIS